jgi:excisionase family DNA binding protein
VPNLNLNHLNSSLPGEKSHLGHLAAKYGRIPAAVARYGLSRSRLYLLAAEGLIRFVKVGKATLVDFESVDAYMASRPAAEIHLSKQVAPAR